MKKKTWVVSAALVAVGLLGLGGTSARAQETSKFDFSADYSYIAHNLTNSYCGDYGDFVECEDPGLQGFKLAGAVNLNSHVGIQCDVSYHAGNHTVYGYAYPEDEEQYTGREADDITTFTCGPKLTERVGNFELFGTLGAGGMHAYQNFLEYEAEGEDPNNYGETAKGTIFGLEVGGGVDWVRKHWGIRLLEVDYVHGTGTLNGRCEIDCSDGGYAFTGVAKANDLQIAMGVNFRFGSTK
jgi:hypothetical protein